jgi:hypothetical protein
MQIANCKVQIDGLLAASFGILHFAICNSRSSKFGSDGVPLQILYAEGVRQLSPGSRVCERTLGWVE